MRSGSKTKARAPERTEDDRLAEKVVAQNPWCNVRLDQVREPPRSELTAARVADMKRFHEHARIASRPMTVQVEVSRPDLPEGTFKPVVADWPTTPASVR